MRVLSLCIVALLSCKSTSDKEASPAAETDNSPLSSQEATSSLPVELGARTPVRLPGVMEPAPWLGEASRVVAFGAADDAVIVAAGTGWLRWFSKDGEQLGEHLSEGGAHVLELFDIDEDGKVEVIVGRGRARGANEASASLMVLHLDAKLAVEEIPLPATSRAQVVAAVASPTAAGELWVASFVSKYEVEVNRFSRSTSGEWALAETRGRHRVVGDMTLLPDGTPVIARMYGDTADEDGGVYALPSAEVALALPSTRGARAVLAMPAPQMAVVMADGWHKDYGKRAQGLITIVAQAGTRWARKSSVEVEKNYGFSRLRMGDVHSQPGLEVVASGNGTAVVMLPERPDLVFQLAGGIAVDAFPIDLGGDKRMEVVIAGPEPAIWSAR